MAMASIHTAFDYRLVALSVVIAVLAIYVGIEFAERAKAHRGSAHFGWLLGGSAAMGSGLWGMFFAGMLAYRLPKPVYYHLPTVALSLVIAVLASYVALFVISRERIAGCWSSPADWRWRRHCRHALCRNGSHMRFRQLASIIATSSSSPCS